MKYRVEYTRTAAKQLKKMEKIRDELKDIVSKEVEVKPPIEPKAKKAASSAKKK